MKKFVFGFMLLLLTTSVWAQPTYPQNGVYDSREGLYAFTNATVYKNYNTKIENATLLIRKGKVERVGSGITVPKEAVVFDLKGKTIYPSFVDIYSDYGMPEAKAIKESHSRAPQMVSNKPGAYGWNEALKPEFKAKEVFTVDGKAAAELRKHGFGALLSHQINGISRGASVLVFAGDHNVNESIIKSDVSHHLSFKKGKSTQDYPRSLMGAIALLRQTYYDAQWYKNGGHLEEINLSLEAWNNLSGLPHIFDVRDRLEAIRADKIGDEFGIQYIMAGNGDEYQRLDELKATNAAFIIPVDFPKAYDVEDAYDAVNVSLAQMMHWELAPSNPALLSKKGIEFAFTAAGLKDKAAYLGNIRKAVENGLSKENALKAMTYTPAKLINASAELGKLETGAYANFIITNGDLFEKETKIYHNWVKGKGFEFKKLEDQALAGNYKLKVGNKSYDLEVSGDPGKESCKIPLTDSTSIKVKHSTQGQLINLSFKESEEAKGLVRLSGAISEDGKEWLGTGTLVDGTWKSWKANYSSPYVKEEGDEKEGEKKAAEKEVKANILYPFVSYGNASLPTAQTYLIKNATVWTNEKDGILENTDVMVRNGKIERIGKNLSEGSCIVIDGTGKHLTSGIIDEHSHIAISRGVNEGTQASSAEVSIADVVNSEDVNIYRQLSGGVTASQLLHGSANPIGGQSAIIKMRWGYAPEAMKFEGAAPFIKFALGENVKQSNWGDANTVRFPQSRMGVEEVYDDHFTRAKEYQASKGKGNYRKDLEMETLLEILNSQRFITCHSYVQSEINMLMKTAERYGFRINTFTHILEGYKVADKMKAHGVGGSTFSDWWAYKYEVIDAIPHNAAILNEQGIVTAINSDDAEMGRRLNQEAAKSIQYADVSEEDAWKFVTLNPAKLLHIDDQTGSIKKGKDADLVLWSGNPLSIYTKAENTWVDGILFFDLKQDMEKRTFIRSERARLIQKMIAEKKNGGAMQAPKAKRHFHYHCDSIEDEIKD